MCLIINRKTLLFQEENIFTKTETFEKDKRKREERGTKIIKTDFHKDHKNEKTAWFIITSLNVNGRKKRKRERKRERTEPVKSCLQLGWVVVNTDERDTTDHTTFVLDNFGESAVEIIEMHNVKYKYNISFEKDK